MKKEKKIDPSKIDVELRSKSVNAFREKYGMLPPDAGYPVLRQHNRQIFFFKSQDDWREYVKATKRVGNQATATIFGMLVVLAFIFIDMFFVEDHQFSLQLLGIFALMWMVCTTISIPQRISTKQTLVYDENDEKICLMAF